MSNIILNEFIINIISISFNEVIYYNHKNGQTFIYMKKGKLMVFMKNKEIIICSSIVMSCLLLIYLYYENTTLQITNYSISSNKIPNEFNDYKIIQISDYHNEKSNRLNKSLIEKLKNEKPDIIVITGDFIDPNRMHMKQSINFVKEIKGIAPIYYVSGNHEAKISNYEEWKNLLEEQEVIILENETKIIEKENSKINIIGINDPKMAHEKSVKNATIINKELEISNYNKDLFSILLSHRPELFRTYVENNIDLVLTGHAHGGQIRISSIGGIVAPNQGLFPKYTSGLFTENNTNMIISRGIGNSIIPFRINNRPELVVITLKTN